MPGIYRMTCGSEIVESSFDFDTNSIGPIKIPISLSYVPEESQSNKFFMYRFYEEMLSNPEALAVFNLNNYCLVVVQPMYMYEVSYHKMIDRQYSKLELVDWVFTKPLQLPTYAHVGYVKTYPKNWAVTIDPYKLIEDTATKELWGFKEKIKGNVQLNPDLSLYKALYDNADAKAVYFDLDKGCPQFIYE